MYKAQEQEQYTKRVSGGLCELVIKAQEKLSRGERSESPLQFHRLDILAHSRNNAQRVEEQT